MAKTKTDLTTVAFVAQMVAVVLVVSALSLARDVFVPLALGVLLSFLLSPIVNRLHRIGVPNVLAVVLTAALTFLLLTGGLTLLGRELTSFVGELPKHKDELVAKARSVAGMTKSMGGSLDALASEVSDAIEGQANSASTDAELNFLQRWTDKLLPLQNAEPNKPPNDGKSQKSPLFVKQVRNGSPLSSVAATAGNVLGPLATVGLVTVFALFMLVYREDLRDRIIAVVSQGNYVTTTEAINEVGQRISRYLIAQTMVNTTYGIVLSLGLATIGWSQADDGQFPNVILWGALATCLRFVPYLGPIIAAAFPLLISLSVFPGYTSFLSVLGLIVTMELLCNNLLEPLLYGTSTGISAVAVIIAAVFWGWLWGPVGLLLSTPLTVCLVVLGRYVPRFKVVSTLLGEKVELKPAMRFYQRLLARDDHRAAVVLREYAADRPLDKACDVVLLPTLRRIRADHRAEQLTEEDETNLFDLFSEVVHTMNWHPDGNSDNTTETQATNESEVYATTPLRKLIGCAAHDRSELMMLRLLELSASEQWDTTWMDAEMDPSEVASSIAAAQPDVVVIAVMPPGGFDQGQYLCRSIRRAGYRGPIVALCFGKFKNYDKLSVKFRKAGATWMTTSLAYTRRKLEALMRPKTTAWKDTPKSKETPTAKLVDAGT